MQPLRQWVRDQAHGVFHISPLCQRWPADGPSIVILDADETFTPFLRGGSMIVSLEFGPGGALYYSQMLDPYDSGTRIGSVLRVRPDGTAEAVVENLTLADGTAFDPDGNLFASIKALGSDATTTIGQILRFDGIARLA